MGFALIAVMAFGAMATGASAHSARPGSDDHGEVTWHDSPDGEPTHELECEFWVKGTNMTNPNGTVEASHSHEPEGRHTHTVGEWEGEPNGSGGWNFEAGPFTVHDTGDHNLTKMYTEWHDDGTHRTSDDTNEYRPCEEEQDQPPEDETEPPACPEDLRAQAHGNENVGLSWNASADADSYHVYRATEDGEMQHVAEVESTSYTDTETEAETTYTYEVTAANDAGEAEDCDVVEVTAIPFFGNPALVAMAAIGSVGAVAAVRTRRG